MSKGQNAKKHSDQLTYAQMQRNQTWWRMVEAAGMEATAAVVAAILYLSPNPADLIFDVAFISTFFVRKTCQNGKICNRTVTGNTFCIRGLNISHLECNIIFIVMCYLLFCMSTFLSQRHNILPYIWHVEKMHYLLNFNCNIIFQAKDVQSIQN